jgi:hypothetical protein
VEQFEPFVPAERVAEHIGVSRRRVLELANIKGGIPSHPMPGRGRNKRKTHRFLLSEVQAWLLKRRT